MKLTAAQLRSIIKEEVSRVLREAPLAKKPSAAMPKVRPGDVYLGKVGRTPVEIYVVLADLLGDGVVHFTQTMSGKPKEMEMSAEEFEAHLADPKYGFEFSHHEDY